MAIYQIATIPDPALTTAAKAVPAVNETVCRVLDNLAATMKDAHGIGLAAPQVKILKRLAVVDTQDGEGVWELINPELLEGKDEKIGWDACLSIPNLSGETMRFDWVRIRTLNRDNEWIERMATGTRARCIQHEMDHLDGILFTDRAIRLYTAKSKSSTIAVTPSTKD